MGNYPKRRASLSLWTVSIIMLWHFMLRRQCFRATAFSTHSNPSQLSLAPRRKRMDHSELYATISFQRTAPLSLIRCKGSAYFSVLTSATNHEMQRKPMASALLMSPKDEESTTNGRNIRTIHSDIPAWQKDLNPTQIEAVTKPIFSITRVVAGPGSGKTRVLTSRIAYLLKEDPKSRILAVTFTRKAAGEMQQRLETLLKESSESTSKNGANGHPGDNGRNGEMMEEEFADGTSSPSYVRDLTRVTLGTFHKICADILRYNGNFLASLPSIERDMAGRNKTLLDGRFAIMDQADQLRIMKDCLAAAGIDLKDSGGIKPLVVLNALGQLKDAINKGEDPFKTNSNKKNVPRQLEIAKKIYGMYRETMLANNLLDFDDLIYLARELLMANQVVRQQLHRRWTHILVDEYQDTSRAQIDLVRLWTSSSLLVVGDGDQSIYSWRGADPDSLSTFDKEFNSYLGGIETVHLTENYRSTANIVNAAQKVIASSADKLRENMTPKRGSGSTPRIVACADEKAEANFVIKTILQKLDSVEYTPDSSVAILYRTNAQSRRLEEACVEYNLPYVIMGKATSFYKRKEVKDCLCFLRWLYNGRDRGSMLRAIQTPSRGLGDKAIQQFEEYCDLVNEQQNLTPLDILLSFTSSEAPGMPLRNETIATRPLKLFTQFAKQMQNLKALAQTQPVEKVLAAVIDTFDLMSYLDKTSDSKAEFEERQSNVQELRQATRRYNKDGPCLQEVENPLDGSGEMDTMSGSKSPLGAFLDDVALVTDIGNREEIEGKEGSSSQKRFVVSLMTIHAAKGMEFDGVFVTGNEDMNFPTSQAIREGKGSAALAEECRLCYVAMTRAKTDLFLTWRRESTVFDTNSATGFKTVNRNRSRFLDALIGTKKNGKSAPSEDRQRRNLSNTANGDKPRNNGYKITSSRRNTQRTNNSQNYGTRGIHQTSKRPISSSSRQSIPTGRSPIARNGLTATSSSPSKRRKAIPETDPAHKRQQRHGAPARVTGSPPPNRPPRKATAMDSTWFFPVGSTVVHRKHGRGLVLNPPPATSPDELVVRVKFEDGQRRDVPAQGDELKPEI